MPSWLLKTIACSITALAAAGSSAYVSGHVKEGRAPLHPPVAGGAPIGAVAVIGKLGPAAPGPAGAVTGGHLNLHPSVQSSDGQTPLTFTSVS
ncbi:MAG: hypothetical protein M3Z13_01550 [Candidatus Dormibacteraeota bacterium]|nr:hypothetical protein [Candidatus Dormibacteraeota bacterium]